MSFLRSCGCSGLTTGQSRKDSFKNAADLLPRLLYIGDVPVEASVHGSALLHRLFEDYPRQNLFVIEWFQSSLPERRIPGSEYRLFKPIWSRLLWTRFNRWVSPFATFRAAAYWRRVGRMLGGFQPEAVITVVHGFGWLAAAEYAGRNGVPLHLIIHDEQVDVAQRLAIERRWVDRALRHWYPRAASRLCISPYMEEVYGRRYGAGGDVLYPSRAADALVYDEPPERLRGSCEPFTVAFAGSVGVEYARALRRIARALRAQLGRLVVYGPLAGDAVHQYLTEPNIELRGMINSTTIIQECRRDAHAMYIPMSFAEGDRINAEIAFPSKLTDSTAVGIPLIINGPEYCSAVRWARTNPDVAEIVTDDTVEALENAISRLQDPERRCRLASAAIRVGRETFSFEHNRNVLHSRLRDFY